MTHRGGAFLLPNEGIEMSEVTRYNFVVWPHEAYVDECHDGKYVKHDDYAALEKERDAECENWQRQCADMQKNLDAVLAENLRLNEMYRQVVKDLDDTCFEMGMMAGEKSMEYPAPETPATDALLNAVRADAIEQAAEKAPWLYGDQMGRSVEAIPKEQLIKWAAQLRAETDTTSSQYESLAG